MQETKNLIPSDDNDLRHNGHDRAARGRNYKSKSVAQRHLRLDRRSSIRHHLLAESLSIQFRQASCLIVGAAVIY